MAQSNPRAEPQSWTTKGDPLAYLQGAEQRVEVAAMLDKAIRTRATVRQLVRITHADQVGSDAADPVAAGAATRCATE
ncbi:hypothetical protein GCM10023317_94810 [Actinopolymorpha pittospori]